MSETDLPTIRQRADHTPSLDLDAIRQRADAATPGPWRREEHTWADAATAPVNVDYYLYGPGDKAVGVVISGILGHLTKAQDDRNRATADFIAHARTDIPALLDENAALRRRLADAEARATRLGEAFKRYGWHHGWCSYTYRHGECSCGFAAVDAGLVVSRATPPQETKR